MVHEHKLIRIQVGITPEPQVYLTFYSTQIGQQETEEYNCMILIKFSSIHNWALEMTTLVSLVSVLVLTMSEIFDD